MKIKRWALRNRPTVARFDHSSNIGQIEAALDQFGSRLELRLRQAA